MDGSQWTQARVMATDCFTACGPGCNASSVVGLVLPAVLRWAEPAPGGRAEGLLGQAATKSGDQLRWGKRAARAASRQRRARRELCEGTGACSGFVGCCEGMGAQLASPSAVSEQTTPARHNPNTANPRATLVVRPRTDDNLNRSARPRPRAPGAREHHQEPTEQPCRRPGYHARRPEPPVSAKQPPAKRLPNPSGRIPARRQQQTQRS